MIIIILALFSQSEIVVKYTPFVDQAIIYWGDGTYSLREYGDFEPIEDEVKIKIEPSKQKSRHNVPLLRNGNIIIPTHLCGKDCWYVELTYRDGFRWTIKKPKGRNK